MTPKKKKIPTKTELLQLQKLYKTDEKIGERLGGVPPYLVAYWRRKKNIPKHSQPKFSEKEIQTLWERYGDDDKCGLELGISKAAFYNWRRRYNIKEKPAFLKLEQLEFNFPGLKPSAATSYSLYNKQTLIQKILAGQLERASIEVGESIEIEPDLIVINQEIASAISSFESQHTDLVWNPTKILMTADSSHPGNGAHKEYPVKNNIREFASRQNIKNIIPQKEGFLYQSAIEKGFILPGQKILCSDMNAPAFGALSTVSFAVSPKELGKVWAVGKYQLMVPKTIRINVNGRRSRGITGKDITISILSQLSGIEVEGKALEFYGNVISQMHISERITLCHQTIKSGAITAICPFDSATRRYLTGRALGAIHPLMADKNAEYDEIYQVNIDTLTPQIVKNEDYTKSNPVAEYDGIPLSLVIIGTDTNGRFDDIRAVSDIIKGKQIHPDCRLLLYPASRSIYLEALKKGLIRVLVEAGAEIIYPGHRLYFEAFQISRERVLSTSDRPFISLNGEKPADFYTASPLTCAASALQGKLTDPTRFLK